MPDCGRALVLFSIMMAVTGCFVAASLSTLTPVNGEWYTGGGVGFFFGVTAIGVEVTFTGVRYQATPATRPAETINPNPMNA